MSIFFFYTQITLFLSSHIIIRAKSYAWGHFNSVAHKWRHDSDKTQTNKLEWWMILKISLRAKGGVPKTLLEQKHRLNFLYFPQNTIMLTESREEFSDLHSIFRLRALRYCSVITKYQKYIIIYVIQSIVVVRSTMQRNCICKPFSSIAQTFKRS